MPEPLDPRSAVADQRPLLNAPCSRLATRACGLLGGRAGARGGSAESAAAKLLLASVAIRHLDLGQLRMRISELRGVALSLVRHLPGRARLSEEVLLRSLPHALQEVALARATVQELGRQQAAEKEAKAAARLLQVISTIGSAAPPIASGPPAFKEAEQRRRLRAEKLEAARARIAADGDASAPGDAGDADAPPAPPPAPPPARAALNASDLRIEWALRRGVSEAAVLDGWLHSASVSEDAPPRSAPPDGASSAQRLRCAGGLEGLLGPPSAQLQGRNGRLGGAIAGHHGLL